jgi:hypothetical protein
MREARGLANGFVQGDFWTISQVPTTNNPRVHGCVSGTEESFCKAWRQRLDRSGGRNRQAKVANAHVKAQRTAIARSLIQPASPFIR